MYVISITDDIQKKARNYSDHILLKPNIKNNPNYTKLCESDRFYNGYVGELCFKELLDNRNIKYKYSVGTTGYHEGEDFIVYAKGIPVSIDVKTASKSYYKYMLMPETQRKYSYDYYVGVRLNGCYSEICGYCQIGGMNYFGSATSEFLVNSLGVPLDELNDIDQLLCNIDIKQNTT